MSDGTPERFYSCYAPLSVDGPLPPRFTVAMVKTIYRNNGHSSKQILKALGIRDFTGSPEQRLRRALDRPDLRRQLCDPRRAPGMAVHQALYFYLRESAHGRGVYERLISRAEFVEDEKTFLDPLRFARALRLERGELISLDPSVEPVVQITPHSADEALAGFVLAFGLLQPHEASELLAPILSLGPAYVEFFGTTWSPAESVSDPAQRASDEATRHIDSVADAGPPSMGASGGVTPNKPKGLDARPADTVLPLASTSTDCGDELPPESVRPSQSEVAGAITSVAPSPSGLETVAAPCDGASTPEAAPPTATPSAQHAKAVGACAAALRVARQLADDAGATRRALGSAVRLDRHAFNEAVAAEVGARDALAALSAAQLSAVDTLCRETEACVSQHMSITLGGPVERNPEEVAGWLDSEETRAAEIAAVAARLDRKLTVLSEIASRSTFEPLVLSGPVALEKTMELLRAREDRLDAALADAKDWQAGREQLEKLLLDCARPKRALSLLRVPPDAVQTLLRRAALDDELEQLIPMLFRLLGETEGWLTEGRPTRACQELRHALDEAARSGDWDTYRELPSYLTPEMLQDLLSSDALLARHIVLTSLLESLARGQPLFLTVIWPCVGWTNRVEAVGELLAPIFGALQQYYIARPSIHLVVDALRLAGVDNTGPADGLASERRRVADDLARRLGQVPSMSGHHHHLRRLAWERYFRPLVSLVRELRFREVRTEVLRLEQKAARGELSSEILSEFADQWNERELRPAHRKSLERYVSGQVSALHDWVHEESTLAEAEEGDDNPLLESIGSSVRQLLQETDESHGHGDVGSVEWLQARVVALLRSLREGGLPEAGLAFFGEVPPLESLFRTGEGTGARDMTAREVADWPGWVEASPRSERLWVCYVRKDRATWADLLQDGIAELLLHRKRYPAEVLDSLFESGEWEAVAATATLDAYRDLPIIGQVIGLLERRGRIEKEVDALDRRVHSHLTAAHALPLAERAWLEDLETQIIEILEAAQRRDLDEGEERARVVAQSLASWEARHSEQATRIADLRAWLSHAHVDLPGSATVEEAEQLVAQTRDLERPRRVHLVKLLDMDQPRVPDALRAAVRQHVRELDHPRYWPSREAAETALFYVELLNDLSRDWWATYRSVGPEDEVRAFVQDILDQLVERLPREFNALVTGRLSDAPMLTALLEPRSTVVREFHANLVRLGVLSTRPGPMGAEPLIGGHRPPSAAGPAVQDERPLEPTPVWPTDPATAIPARLVASAASALGRLEKLLLSAGGAPGTGADVQRALDAFGESDFNAAMRHSAAAWQWVRTTPDPHLLREPLAGVYGWSRLRVGGACHEQADVDALAVILRHASVLRDRGRLTDQRLLEWWLQYQLGSAEATPADPPNSRVAAELCILQSMPDGHRSRERFRALLGATDPALFAELLWDGVRSTKEYYGARVALLVLLYDLGSETALHGLFESHAGAVRKYLLAFVRLNRRATTDSSLNLDTALRQTLRTIDQKLTGERGVQPVVGFARQLVARLRPSEGEVKVGVAEVLERHDEPDQYRLLVTITPDETDPPFTLDVELVSNGDFQPAEGTPARFRVVTEELLLERRELEFSVTPCELSSASTVSVSVRGESTSGRQIQHHFRLPVRIGSESVVATIPDEKLLEIYQGYDARPVKQPAFVGREEELRKLERVVARGNPGGVVVYGARRLGKTSLLDEVRRRFCVSQRGTGQTLFLVVPVDEFSVGDRPFLDGFLGHIWFSVMQDPKNEPVRAMLEREGATRATLQQLGSLGDGFDGASFLMRLREHLRRLRGVSNGKVRDVVLVLDEFDKLLEHYRRGHEASVEELVNQLRRAATEEADIGFILAGSEFLRSFVGQYRNALFGSVAELQLECFDTTKHRTEVHDIIVPPRLEGLRVFGEAVVDDIIRIAGGHPLYMRLVALAAAHLSNRQHVSRGKVLEAVQRLLCNGILDGYLTDPVNLVRQQLDALHCLKSDVEESLSWLLLLQIAGTTTLEHPWTNWGTVVHSDALASLRAEDAWVRIRDQLVKARVVVVDEKRRWSFRFPILAELLRRSREVDFESWSGLLKTAKVTADDSVAR